MLRSTSPRDAPLATHPARSGEYAAGEIKRAGSSTIGADSEDRRHPERWRRGRLSATTALGMRLTGNAKRRRPAFEIRDELPAVRLQGHEPNSRGAHPVSPTTAFCCERSNQMRPRSGRYRTHLRSPAATHVGQRLRGTPPVVHKRHDVIAREIELQSRNIKRRSGRLLRSQHE